MGKEPQTSEGGQIRRCRPGNAAARVRELRSDGSSKVDLHISLQESGVGSSLALH